MSQLDDFLDGKATTLARAKRPSADAFLDEGPARPPVVEAAEAPPATEPVNPPSKGERLVLPMREIAPEALTAEAVAQEARQIPLPPLTSADLEGFDPRGEELVKYRGVFGPLVTAPKLSAEEVAAFLPRGTPAAIPKVLAGIQRGGASVAEGLTSPFNAVLVAVTGGASLIPGVGAVVQRGAGAVFGALMAKDAAEQAGATVGHLSEGDYEAASETATVGTLDAIFAGLSGNQALKGIFAGKPKAQAWLAREVKEKIPAADVKAAYEAVRNYDPRSTEKTWIPPTPAQVELVRFINEQVGSPGKAIKQGVEITGGQTVFSPKVAEWLGIPKGEARGVRVASGEQGAARGDSPGVTTVDEVPFSQNAGPQATGELRGLLGMEPLEEAAPVKAMAIEDVPVPVDLAPDAAAIERTRLEGSGPPVAAAPVPISEGGPSELKPSGEAPASGTAAEPPPPSPAVEAPPAAAAAPKALNPAMMTAREFREALPAEAVPPGMETAMDFHTSEKPQNAIAGAPLDQVREIAKAYGWVKGGNSTVLHERMRRNAKLLRDLKGASAELMAQRPRQELENMLEDVGQSTQGNRSQLAARLLGWVAKSELAFNVERARRIQELGLSEAIKAQRPVDEKVVKEWGIQASIEKYGYRLDPALGTYEYAGPPEMIKFGDRELPRTTVERFAREAEEKVAQGRRGLQSWKDKLAEYQAWIADPASATTPMLSAQEIERIQNRPDLSAEQKAAELVTRKQFAEKAVAQIPESLARIEKEIRDAEGQVKHWKEALNPKPAPWQIRRDEYAATTTEGNPTGPEWKQHRMGSHRREVELALKAGKDVPIEVLADYPDMAKPKKAPTIEDVVKAGQAPRKGPQMRVQYMATSAAEAQRVKDLAGEDVSGTYHVMDDDFVRKTLKDHGDPATEAKRGNVAVTPEDFSLVPQIVSSPDGVQAVTKDGVKGLVYAKRFNGTTYLVETGPNKNQRLLAKTMWKKPTQPQQSSPRGAPLPTSETLPGQTSSSGQGSTIVSVVKPPVEGPAPAAVAAAERADPAKAPTTKTLTTQKQFILAALDEALKTAPEEKPKESLEAAHDAEQANSKRGEAEAVLDKAELAVLEAQATHDLAYQNAMERTGKPPEHLAELTSAIAISQAARKVARDAARDAQTAYAMARRAEMSAVGTVTIEVPGDGTFEILKTKEAIREARKRLGRLGTGLAPKKYALPASSPRDPPAFKPKPTAKDVLSGLEPFASKDSSRFSITDVAGFGDVAVATDGRRLAWARGKWPGTPKTPKALLGIIDLDNHQYPNWKQVVPDEVHWVAKVDPEVLWRLGQQALQMVNENSLAVKLYVNDAGQIGLQSGSEEIGEYTGAVNLSDPKTHLVAGLNLEMLLDWVTLARRSGDKEIWIGSSQGTYSPVVFAGENWRGVQMPLRVTDGSEVSFRESGLTEIAGPQWPGAGFTRDAAVKRPKGGKVKKTKGAEGLQPLPEAEGEPLRLVSEATAAPEGPRNGGKGKVILQWSKSRPGLFAEVELAGVDEIPAMEMPELYELVQRLLQKPPEARRLSRNAGLFRHEDVFGQAEVFVNLNYFANPIEATKILAHEIGHLVDWLPDHTVARGNLLGHLYVLRNFLGSTFGEGSAAITPKERAQLRRAAEKQVGGRPPKDDQVELAHWRAEVAKVYRELVGDVVEKRHLTTAQEIREELVGASESWSPIGENAPQGYIDYRHSAKELYADALSVLLTGPAKLKEWAPTFWREFWKTVDKKPEVKRALFELYDLINQGAEAVGRQRRERIGAMFGKGEEIFMRKVAERRLQRESFRGWHHRLLQSLHNIFQPAIDRQRTLEAKGIKLPAAERMDWLTEEHVLAQNLVVTDLIRTWREVVKPLEDAGVPLGTLGEYLFLDRVANERVEVAVKVRGKVTDETEIRGRTVVANPLGQTPDTARATLEAMTKSLTPEQLGALLRAARAFHVVVRDAMKAAVDEGLISKQTWTELLEPNWEHYATFVPLDYVDTYVPAGVIKQVGTFKEIENPFLATVLKLITLRRATQFQHTKRGLVDFWMKYFPQEISAAETMWNGKANIPRPPREPEKDLLEVREDGKRVGYVVPSEVAGMLDRLTPASASAVTEVLHWGFKHLFYPLFIKYNPAFQLLWSPIRDARRTLVNRPNALKASSLAKEFFNSMREAASWTRNDPSPLVQEMIGSFAMGTPFDSYARVYDREDAFGEILREFNLSTDPKRLDLRKVKILKPLLSVLDGIEWSGQIMNAAPKIGTYKVLTRELGWAPPQAAAYVRNHIGMPNNLRRGKHSMIAGSLIPFYDVFRNSWYDDAKMAVRGKVDGKTRGSYWLWWMLAGGGLWTVCQALAELGVFGDDLKDEYAGFSEYSKMNYNIVPLGTVPGGQYGRKAVGMMIPQDETHRVINGIMRGLIVRVARLAQGDPRPVNAGALLDFTAGQIPGINPLVGLGAKWADYLQGKNPVDSFRNRSILTNDQYLAGGWEGFKPMLTWTWNQSGLGNFFRYNREADTTAELVFGSAPILGKLIKVTDFGYREAQMQGETVEDAQRAAIRVGMPENVRILVSEYSMLRGLGASSRTPEQGARWELLRMWYNSLYKPQFEAVLQAEQNLPEDQAKAFARQAAETMGTVSKTFERNQPR